MWKMDHGDSGKNQVRMLNIDKTFILTHAAPTCGKIFPGNKGENTQRAKRGRRVS